MYPQQPQYPPGYGQPQQQPAYPYPGLPQAPAQPPAGMPPMSNGPTGPAQMPAMSDATFGGAIPSISELDGRAVLVLPTHFDPQAKALQPTAERPYSPTVTLTVWVLDGGPLTYGASQQKGRPPTHRVDSVPAKFVGVLSSHENIVRGLSDKVNTGVVLGRIKRGITTTQGRNAPWNLAPLDDAVPADAAAREIANGVRAAVNAGTFVSPTPIELQPAQAPAGPQYAPQAPAQPMAYPPAGYPQYAPQAPAQQVAPAPPGFPPGLWAQMTPQDQAAYLAANGQQGAPAPAGPPMPAGY